MLYNIIKKYMYNYNICLVSKVVREISDSDL